MALDVQSHHVPGQKHTYVVDGYEVDTTLSPADLARMEADRPGSAAAYLRRVRALGGTGVRRVREEP